LLGLQGSTISQSFVRNHGLKTDLGEQLMKLAEMTFADVVKAALMVLVLAVAGVAMAADRAEAQQSNLPRCPRNHKASWHNCFGTLTADNNKYVGEFEDDKRNGVGTYTFANGDKYVGEFKDGMYNGQGTLTLGNGNTYIGQFKDGMFNGQGTYTLANGDKYVGEFKDAYPNGQGTKTFANGEKYVGEFKDNKYNGQGLYTFPDGTIFVGEFKDHKHNGQGTYTLANGDKYVGEFKDDYPNGQGTYTFANGDKYVGEFKDGMYNGQGTFTFTDGEKYVGGFKDGEYNGQGSSYANGNKYVGEFKDNRYNGQGTLTLPNGDKYVGEFKDDKRNGNGKEFAANGTITRSGYWNAGDYSAGSRIKMVKDGGTYTVPVTINGVLPLHFTVDSGASDVQIPSDVVSTLIRMGAITRSDFIGSQEYQLADGSTIESRTFRIRSLKVGERTVQNVKGSVAGPNGSLLLGQSFLETFKSWSMDNTKHELVLE
jgi:hypothetical protein